MEFGIVAALIFIAWLVFRKKRRVSDTVEISSDVAEGRTYEIDYEDSKGKITRRKITVSDFALTDTDKLLIEAHCHRRNAARTFRADRMHEITDLETGETWDNPADWVRTFEK